MQKMYSFEDFLFENLDLTFFTIGSQLSHVLQQINDPIAIQIHKDASWQPIQSKITLIELDKQELDKWWFVNSVKVNQFLEDKHEDKFVASPSKDSAIYRDQLQYFLLNRSEIMEKYKTSTRIGRVINKIYPNKYKPTEIEEFVNKYKKYFTGDFDLIDVVRGKDINHWYDCDNYNTSEVRGSELQNSCMRHKEKSHFMDFYSLNDVEMVVLYSDKDKKKIDARAILWTPGTIDGEKNTEGRKFMDRIYYNKQSHINILQKYAENKGWFLKSNNSGSVNGFILDPKTNEKEKVIFTIEDVKIPEHRKVPFADTLAIFDPETNTLSNDDGGNRKIGWLSSTGGSLEGLRWLPYKNRFYHSTDIGMANGLKGEEAVLKSDAILLPAYRKLYTRELLDTKELVKVNSINGGTVEVFKEDVVEGSDGKKYFKKEMNYSDFLDEYIPKNKAAWVSNMDTWMPDDQVVKVVTGWSKNYTDWGSEYTLNYDTEFYHMDDPREPFFKHTDGRYYLNDLKDKIEKTNSENEKD